MFRFALRSKASDLSDRWLSREVFTPAQIKEIALAFAATAYEMLFFLKSIRKIEFYELDENNKLRQLKSHRVNFKNDYDKTRLARFWSDFRDEVDGSQKKQFVQVNYRVLRLNLFIESTHPDQVRQFYVSQQFGFAPSQDRACWNEIAKLEKDRPREEFKLFPLAGIAFDLDLTASQCYKMYNSLPLHQKSPIACHVNGCFALHRENRTQIFQHSKIAVNNKINSAEADWRTGWNTALIRHIVLHLFLGSMAERARIGLEGAEEFSTLIDNFLSVFPRPTGCQLSKYFEPLRVDFYKLAVDIDCIPVYSRNEERIRVFKPAQLIFPSKLSTFLKDVKEKDQQREVHQAVSAVVQEYCWYDKLPDLLHENLKQLDSSVLLERLRDFRRFVLGVHVNDSIFKSVNTVIRLLCFCICDQVPQVKNSMLFLDNVPLMVTSDCRISAFSRTNKVYRLNASHVSFFKQFYQAEFAHASILEVEELQTDTNFFKKFAISNLDPVFRAAFGAEAKLPLANPYPKLDARIERHLKIIWQFIVQSIEEQSEDQNWSRADTIQAMSMIRDWALIPVASRLDSSVKLAPVRDLQAIFGSSYHTKMQMFLAKQFYLSVSYDMLNRVFYEDKKLM